MADRRVCRLCVLACVGLLLVTAAMLAMPFCHDSRSPGAPSSPLPANFRIDVGLVDPATIGSEDRAEMSWPAPQEDLH